MMQFDQQIVIVYVLFWILRIRGCIRRGQQPRLRGPEWFFNVPVPPGFYDGPGKRLLRQYWIRMMIPFAIDIPLAIAIFVSGRLLYLPALVVGLVALIHALHAFSVNLAERQARPFAAADSEPPVARLALSLQTRRLRDYASPRIEWIIALLSLAGIAACIRYYVAAPDHHDVKLVFAAPLLLLYGQAGMLFVKQLVLSWRRPVPQDYAAEYMEASEQTRRFYLLMCDWLRLTMALVLVMGPVQLGMSPEHVEIMMRIWFPLWTLFAVVGGVWIEIKRKQLADLAVRARPVKMPDFLGESEIARWPVCYQPSAPMLMLKGARGYSLNLANRLAQYSAAYLAGGAVLVFILRMTR